MKLRSETVSPSLAELLRGLMRNRELDRFALGGGTSLALRLGHRVSIDIDLFAIEEFDAEGLSESLSASAGLGRASVSTNSITGEMRGIKVDLIAHRYPLVAALQTIGGVRMLSLPDVAAMKLNAIRNRGAKKDFWDLAELLSIYSIQEMFGFFAGKYPHANLWSLTRSILYFNDAEPDPTPRDLRGRSWEEVKSIIRAKVRL